MKIDLVSINSLKGSEYNPRALSKQEFQQLKTSLDRFGFVEPLVVNGAESRRNVIIGGHQRFHVAKKIGMKQVPVHFVSIPDLKKERELNLRLNRNVGHWDWDMIANFDLSELMDAGFLKEELEKNLGIEIDPPKEEGDIPEVPKEPVTKKGDLWLLGEHRLLCGDATNPEDVEKLMDGEKADLFQTDPPYLVDYTGTERPNSGKDWSGSYHDIDIKDARKFLTDFFSLAIIFLKDNAAWYCWHAHKRQSLIENVWHELGIINHQQIIWVKPSAVFGFSFYPFQHEPCLFGWKKGFKPNHDGDNFHSITSVWNIDWEGKARIVGNEHPTQKPLEIFKIPMRKHTQKNSICYEPFSGSGSQLIAAEQLTRKCYGLEIEPVFCDVIVKRWENYTGKKAILDK